MNLSIFRPEKYTGRFLLLPLVAALLLTACKGSGPQDRASESAEVKLDEWSWLPNSNRHDAELAQIPRDAELELMIPKEQPLTAKSSGWGKVRTGFEFVPTDNKSYAVSGGALLSRLGGIEKKATWGDWDFVYGSARKEQTPMPQWGYTITSGEILLPRSVFVSPPTDAYVENSFEIEAFGDSYVLIHLDPAKGHRLCFLQVGRSQLPTAGFIGTKAEVNGKTLERRADGWYRFNVKGGGQSDSKRMSQASSSLTLEKFSEKADDEADAGASGPTIQMIAPQTTTETPLYVSKFYDFPADSSSQPQGKQPEGKPAQGKPAPRKTGHVSSEGWLAYNPPIQPTDKVAALVNTPKGKMIAGNLLLGYKIDKEERYGFIAWRE